MEFRIEQKEAIRIVGVSMPIEQDIEKNFAAVPAMWGRAAQDGTIPRLCEKMNSQPMGVLGVSVCNNDAEAWKYWIAVASTADAGEFEEYVIPPATWAIFQGQGTGLSIQELEKKIVTEWLPSSGYEYGAGPDVEVYLDPDPADTKYEVWIPVVKQ